MKRRQFAALAAATFAVPAVLAQDRTLKILVGFPPGGSVDVIARLLADKLRVSLGQNVIVDNKPGAGGRVALNEIKKAAPDGQTVVLSPSGALVIQPWLFANLGYDPVKDFTPIAMYARLPIVLVMPPSLPVRTIPELVAYAHANPGKLNYASVSPGTTSHILGEMLKLATKTEIEHIPYKGGAPALTALLAGEVQLLFSSLLEAMPHIKAGKIRALGVADARRVNGLADVPTLGELGLDFNTPIWYGLFAPAGTPTPIVQKIAADVLRIAAQDDMKQFLAAQGAEPAQLGPEPFRDLVVKEHAKYGAVVRDAGMKSE